MDLKLDIDAKKIEEMVTKAVLESSLGEKVKTIITSFMTDLDAPFKKSPVRDAIEAEVRSVIFNVIRNDFRAQIEEYVKKNMTDAILNEIIEKAWNTLLDKD